MPAELVPAFWAAATIAAYLVAKAAHRRHRRLWTSPALLTPTLLLALASALHAGYHDYLRGTHWLLAMLGPATVAFALPIHQQRALIRRHWPALAVGVAAGSTIAIASAWGLASWLQLDPELRLSLLPRSITTPFALSFAADVGGVPELAAVFVVLTGLCGATLGELLLRWLPLRSALARGALFGMGAHVVGVAKARDVGTEEGSVAGLVMVLAGLLNVVAAPLIAHWLH